MLLLMGLLSAGCQQTQKNRDWVSIFNGNNLDGWIPKFYGQEPGENYLNTFQVKDGKLKVAYDHYQSFDDKFGHLFFDQKLSHFRLRLDYRFTGQQVPGAPDWAYKNSGVKFHSQPPQQIPVDQRLLVAIETQLLGGNGKDNRPTANVCTAGTHIEMNGQLITQHCTPSSSPTFHDDQWVHLEIEVLGHEKITHWVNGEKVLEYANPQLDPEDPFAQELVRKGKPILLSEGYIALQAESHPVEFRNIELMILAD